MSETENENGQKPGFLKRVKYFFLRFDSWIDSSIWSSFKGFGDFWENLTIFFHRFRVTGFKKVLVEIVDEGANIGTAGFVLLLALALPSFEATDGNWRAQDELSVTFLDRYGNEIGNRGNIREKSLPVDQLPEHLIQSVLATEDRRFYQHFGIDFIGLTRAMAENARANSVVQGGSTLTQQLAKLVFLTSERTLTRKIKEAFLALWLEANLTKNEILQLYLDRAYMGGGTFGASAAAQFYFGKDIKDVNLAEAAMLAGLFKAPAKYAPHVNLPAARARANEVLTNLVQGGMMTEGQVVGARRSPAVVVDRGDVDSPDFFLDWAFDEVKRLSPKFDEKALVVRTTIDLGLQGAAEFAVESGLREFGTRYRVRQGATVVIENGGAVRAMVGGQDYGRSQFNRATSALRQPGSSFKPYVYALAMESGFTPQSKISDGPITWNGWSPRNYGRSYSGRMDLTRALVKSVNTIPVRLARDHLSTPKIAAKAMEMGVQSVVRSDKTMPLGTSEVTVMDQATGYAVFPAGGKASNRHGVTQIMNYSGDILFDHARDVPPPKQVLTAEAAAAMNEILTQVPEWGTGRRAKLEGIKTAGKTGTTQSYRDAWFVGYTGNYTAAVWFGNDDFTTTARMTGGSLPAMTFKKLMEYAHQGVELRALPGIEDALSEETIGPLISAENGGIDQQALPSRARLLNRQASSVLRDLAQILQIEPKPKTALKTTPEDPLLYLDKTPTGSVMAASQAKQ
jgi:penicillin-binding protein 1A